MSGRIGLLGPCGGDVALLRRSAEFLLRRARVELGVYLGEDGEIDGVVQAWREEIASGGGWQSTFWSRAGELAKSGDPDDIERLLVDDETVSQLDRLRRLPESPSRAIEMLGDRIVILVHDHDVLDEDDIRNASIIGFGRSEEPLLKRFGKRHFFSPGPLEGGVGVLEQDRFGKVSAAVYSLSGETKMREVLQGSTTKVLVSG